GSLIGRNRMPIRQWKVKEIVQPLQFGIGLRLSAQPIQSINQAALFAVRVERKFPARLPRGRLDDVNEGIQFGIIFSAPGSSPKAQSVGEMLTLTLELGNYSLDRADRPLNIER